MCTSNELLARIEDLDIEQVCEDAFNLNAEIAEDLNREQLQRGEGAIGEMPDYSRASVEFYGKPEGGIRLYDKGSFYEGITFGASNGTVSMFSTDSKNSFLENQYALAQPLGLNEKSRVELNKVLQPTVVELVKDELNI